MSSLSKRSIFVQNHMYKNDSYSQEGEDLIVFRLLDAKRKGFFVDIGAHHPIRFSNTYMFYKLGWRGINIDAMPGAMRMFDKVRPRDINLECGIAANEGELQYFIFDEPALNTFNSELARHQEETSIYRINKTEIIKVRPLKEVLEKYIAAGQKIDFMTIDVEGMEEEVLKSNDWAQFRPEIVVVEAYWNDSFNKIIESNVYQFLQKQGYYICSKLYNSTIYIDGRR